MTASDSTRLQVNFRTPNGALINLYAVGLADLQCLLDEVSNVAGKIAQTEALLSGSRNVALQLGGEQVATEVTQQAPAEQFVPPNQGPPPAFAQPQPQAPQQPQQPGGGPVCQHGQMVFKSGGGGNTGKRAWSAWMCPLPKNTPGACPPQWQ